MIGAGGMIVGTGGMIVGTGGMIVGIGGTMVGTGGSRRRRHAIRARAAAAWAGCPAWAARQGWVAPAARRSARRRAARASDATANHTCELDPASTWDLAAISAAVSPMIPTCRPPDSTNWDPPSGEIGGVLPDPFVELDFLTTRDHSDRSHRHRSSTRCCPNWGALVPATLALLNPPGSPMRASDLMAGGKNWQISVFDDDDRRDDRPVRRDHVPDRRPAHVRRLPER